MKLSALDYDPQGQPISHRVVGEKYLRSMSVLNLSATLCYCKGMDLLRRLLGGRDGNSTNAMAFRWPPRERRVPCLDQCGDVLSSLNMPNQTIEIRRGLPGDHQALNEIMKSASVAIESGEVLSRLLAEPAYLELDKALLDNGQVVVATFQREPIGFASFLIGGSDAAELDGMFVRPEYWRRGIGRQILKAVEYELLRRQASGIRVVAGISAVDFYKSVGFTIVGEEKTPLGPVVPVMRKTILRWGPPFLPVGDGKTYAEETGKCTLVMEHFRYDFADGKTDDEFMLTLAGQVIKVVEGDDACQLKQESPAQMRSLTGVYIS